jgi:hypothetical protein
LTATQYQVKKILLLLLACLSGCFATLQANPILRKADSLFANDKLSAAASLYEQAFSAHKITSKANLLKMAFLEENRGNAVRAMYYLNQFYLLQPEAAIKTKIEDMATQNKLQGYSIDEADYGYFLYRTYGPWVENLFLALGVLVFSILIFRKAKGISLGYSPIFTLLFLAAAVYFFNVTLPYKRAIVAQDGLFLMSGPSSGSSVEGILSKGHRLEWIDQKDVWFEVRWNEKKGWVKKSGLLFFL